MTTAIWWMRRDLRLDDNPALEAALSSADEIIPLFILDPVLWNSDYTGEQRKAFLLENLRALHSDLDKLGSGLIIREGNPLEALTRIYQESNAGQIFAQADVSPYARTRDEKIKAELPLELTEGLTIQPLNSARKQDGQPYTVFTPYSRAWRALPTPTVSKRTTRPEMIQTPDGIDSNPIPESTSYNLEGIFPPGEYAAVQRLKAFSDGPEAPITRYGEDRNRPDIMGTSALSPYLRFGVLSPRRAAAAALQTANNAASTEIRKSANTWLSELIWREFYIDILYHFPQVRVRSYKADLENIKWSNNPQEYEAWCTGRTGYPIVDAAMRQLAETGWMHNRSRMLVASFLVKDLLIDWRWGERWFMQHLLDGDPASNNGGWQWTAGTGTDAAPYFRIFNPILQGKKSDPDGAYVRKWLPKLREVPNRFVHEPWSMPEDVQVEVGCTIGQDYPAPIVDHAWARKRALAEFQSARDAHATISNEKP